MVRPRKALLLTGAGFSRPFGGYLASEMWALVFRQKEVRASETLRKRMLAELNFELVYEEALLSSEVNTEEKQGFTEAVWRAYSQMHTEMSSQQYRGAAYALIRAFVSRFMSQDNHERGFVFTLNQDFLVERHTYSLTMGLAEPRSMRRSGLSSIGCSGSWKSPLRRFKSSSSRSNPA